MNQALLKTPYLISKNIGTLRDFYSNALGLQLRFQDEEKWCQMSAGKIDFAISSPQEAFPCTEGVVLVFSVQDITSAKTQIINAGGKVVHERSMGEHGNVCTCCDIEGNQFQIHAKAIA